MPSEPTDGEPVEYFDPDSVLRPRDPRGEDQVLTASGGMCMPMAPMYSFGELHWYDLHGAGWPRRFVLFPRASRIARRYGVIRREATERIVVAWRTLRHGVQDEEDDW